MLARSETNCGSAFKSTTACALRKGSITVRTCSLCTPRNRERPAVFNPGSARHRTSEHQCVSFQDVITLPETLQQRSLTVPAPVRDMQAADLAKATCPAFRTAPPRRQ